MTVSAKDEFETALWMIGELSKYDYAARHRILNLVMCQEYYKDGSNAPVPARLMNANEYAHYQAMQMRALLKEEGGANAARRRQG